MSKTAAEWVDSLALGRAGWEALVQAIIDDVRAGMVAEERDYEESLVLKHEAELAKAWEAGWLEARGMCVDVAMLGGNEVCAARIEALQPPGGKFPTQHQPKEHTMPTIEELQSKNAELESLISKLMAERNAPPGAMPPFPAEKTAEQKAYLNGCKDQCEKDAKMFDEFVPGNAKHIRDNLITEPPQP